MAMLAGALTFSILNGTLSQDAFFAIVLAAMIPCYSTVGAVLLSRSPGNPIGWLMLAVGLSVGLTSVATEYTVYTYVTAPGSLPFGRLVALISNSVWLPMFTSVILFLLLYPSGTVIGPRWRRLPGVVIGLSSLAFVAGLLYPGDLDLDLAVPIVNPLGVPALKAVTDGVATVAWTSLVLVTAPLSIISLVLRYRRSRGEERQQLRWLATIAATTGGVIVVGIVTALIMRDAFTETPTSNLFNIAGFALLGVGVPVAVGIAVLRYRLYDLDLVVKKTVLYAIVAALLTATFVAVAVAIGWVAGRTDVGAAVAAGAIGLAFWPALRLARRLADRIVYGRRATPYEVLANFSTRVGASYGDEDVLPRMAQILRDAIGASRATVWLRVGDRLRPAGIAPTGDAPPPVPVTSQRTPDLPADLAVEVHDRGELLGALAVSMPPNDPIDPPRERLVRDLAAQVGLVLRNVRLIEELRASRQRLVAAQDQERRRIERNIHDGAQQELVALSVKLRLAQGFATKDPERTAAMLGELGAETQSALENLRDLARGIYPPLLADRGLREAIEAQARKAGIPAHIESDGIGRYPPDVEAAVYFCTLEAFQNVAKYAGASSIAVSLAERDGRLEFEIIDDGAGFDPVTVPLGSGLQNMGDRLEALGGSVEIRSAPGFGTTVAGSVPSGREVAT